MFRGALESDAAFRTGLKLATNQPCAPLTLALLCHSDVARSGSTLLIDGWLSYAMDDSILDKLLVLRLRLRAALSATVARAPLSARLRKAADAARDVLAAEQRRLIGTGRNSVGGTAIRAGRGRGRGRDGGRGKGESRGGGREPAADGTAKPGGKAARARSPSPTRTSRSRSSRRRNRRTSQVGRRRCCPKHAGFVLGDARLRYRWPLLEMARAGSMLVTKKRVE